MVGMKYVVCYSGGHSSALAAIETVRRYGKDKVILLNHDISPKVERADTKEYKERIADKLGLPVQYANAEGWEDRTPLVVAREKRLFQKLAGQKFCTYELKTKPFYDWIKTSGYTGDDVTFVYGFDAKETERIERRRMILGKMGFETLFPLAELPRTIFDTKEIGVEKPVSYCQFKHSNCVGCLKAGKMHWYMVYCLYPEIFAEAVFTEKSVGQTIIKGVWLEDLIPLYEEMKQQNIEPSDNCVCSSFWKSVRDTAIGQQDLLEL